MFWPSDCARRRAKVRADVVAAKVARARAWLKDAETIFAADGDSFVADRRSRDLALFYLFLAVQESIDIAAHWVADEGGGRPKTRGRPSMSCPSAA